MHSVEKVKSKDLALFNFEWIRMDKLSKDTDVQICRMSSVRYEYFWVIVKKINKNFITGIIDHYMMHPVKYPYSSDLHRGESIKFTLANICAIHR